MALCDTRRLYMLVDILKRLGPCLSTDLTDYLVTHCGLSPAAARQRVSRGVPEIKRLAHMPFLAKRDFYPPRRLRLPVLLGKSLLSNFCD